MSLYRMAQVYGSVLEGFRKGLEIACPVQVGGGDDLARCLLPVKMTLAFSTRDPTVLRLLAEATSRG